MAVMRFRLPDGVELTFRFEYDGLAVPAEQWFRGPQCRARTRSGRRCRNLVFDGQPGPWIPGEPPGMLVEDPADAIRLREQACRVHAGVDFADFCAQEWSRN